MGLKINTVVREEKESSTVHASGDVQHVITDTERGTFDIEDDDLKDAVETYFGHRPNDAYLHSPTPWHDLYKQYGWPQVKLVLEPLHAEITDVESQKQTLTEHTFENDSDQPATYHANLTQEETETATSSWSETDTISVSQSVNYGVEFKGLSIGGETSMSYNHTWGQGGSESKSIAVGTSSGVSVTLDPHSKMRAILSASKNQMKVRVRYRAHLTGRTAVNYNPTYQGHHFWALPIRSVMTKSGRSPTREFTEDITLGYYADSKIRLVGPDGETVSTIRTADEAASARMATYQSASTETATADRS